jgi:hypothetical protein
MKERVQDVEHGNSVSETSVKVGFGAMMDFLGFANDGQQGKGRFDDHAVIPGALFAELDVIRNAVGAAKAPISQNNRLPIVFLEEIQEIVIRAVHSIPNPAAHLTEGVEYPAQLHANAPAAFIFALFSELLGGASFTDRENQFNGKTVHDIQHAGLGQQQVGVALLFSQLPQHARSMRQAPEQISIVSLQAAVERSEMPAFERKQNTYRHHFAWIQLGAWVFADARHRVIDMIENVNDNILCRHDLCLSVSLDNYSLALFMTISTCTTG